MTSRLSYSSLKTKTFLFCTPTLSPIHLLLSLNFWSRYRIGEAFVHLPYPRALKRLEKDQDRLSKELSKIGEQVEGCETEMGKLKALLYGKFGKAINLDE